MAVAPVAKNLFDDFLVIGLKSAVTSPVPTLLYCFRTAQGQGGAAVDTNNVALMEFCFHQVASTTPSATPAPLPGAHRDELWHVSAQRKAVARQ